MKGDNRVEWYFKYAEHYVLSFYIHYEKAKSCSAIKLRIYNSVVILYHTGGFFDDTEETVVNVRKSLISLLSTSIVQLMQYSPDNLHIFCKQVDIASAYLTSFNDILQSDALDDKGIFQYYLIVFWIQYIMLCVQLS